MTGAIQSTSCVGQTQTLILVQEDGAEVAVVLKRVAAGRPLREVPDAEIAAALRDFERRRSSRCGAEIAQARRVGNRNVFPKSWLVRARQHTCRIAVPLL